MNYTLKINQQEFPVYETTVYPPPYNNTEKMDYAIIPLEGAGDYELTSEIPVESVTIRPLRLGISCTFEQHTIRFHLDKPEKISVEINGSYKNNIVLFASAPRQEELLCPDSKVLRYAAGEHNDSLDITEDHTVLILETGVVLEGRINIRNCNYVTVFVDYDAILHGILHIENCNHLKICGFGSLCSERFLRGDPNYQHLLEAKFCKDLVIRDITLLDSCNWTCRIFGCDDVYIDNINIVGCRGNSDGVDICGTRNALVEHCFIRTWDDCFVAKSFDTGNLENITFRDSTLWNDFARPLEVGVEIRAEYARNITFENIDILHSVTGYPTMGIHHGDRAKLRNITFSDIRLEDVPGGQIFDIRITDSVWNEDTQKGDIDGLVIKNIFWNDTSGILPSRSRLQGFSKEYSIRNVTLENFCFRGKFASTLEECHVDVQDFVDNVQILCPTDAPKMRILHSDVSVVSPFVFGEDGLYHGTVSLLLENKNPETISGLAHLQISPVHMTDLPDADLPYTLKTGEKITKEFALSLQPGKYVFAVQSADPVVESSWHYEELRLPLASSIDTAPMYKIVNYYNDCISDVQLAAEGNKLIIRSEALRKNTFTIYSAAPVDPLPGEVKFTVEETDFGEAMAIMDGPHGLESAPQLRTPLEITYVFLNEPKVKEILCNTVGGNGSNTVEIPFTALGIKENASEVWFDVIANLPEVQNYRYAFAMFHSVQPQSIAHMFARADIPQDK